MTESQPRTLDPQWLAQWRDEITAVSQQLQRTSPWRLLRIRRLRAEWSRLDAQIARPVFDERDQDLPATGRKAIAPGSF
jgi:hypothetical protein